MSITATTTLPIRNIVSVDDFEPSWVSDIFVLTKRLKTAHAQGVLSNEWSQYREILKHFILVSFFYEESTRTRLSTESAMLSLGGAVESTQDASRTSSLVKGESLTDSIRIASLYGQVLVLRHPEIGSARIAAAVSKVPVINAGDGAGEHPTQALLDWYTIWERFFGRNNQTLTLVGDLKNGRTIHSQVKEMVILKDTDLNPFSRCIAVSPDTLSLPKDLLEMVQANGIPIETSRFLTPDIVRDSSVIYMTRTQKEREGENFKVEEIVLTRELAELLPVDSLIMHPLPRNAELPEGIDSLPQAHYFEQAENGLYIRMAILIYLLRPDVFKAILRDNFY